MKERQFKVGDKVEIISTDNMFAPKQDQPELIGSDGAISKVDDNDNKLPYCLNTGVWTGDENIKLK